MQSDLTSALGILREAGVRVDGGGLDDLAMTLPDGTQRTARVNMMRRSPSRRALEGQDRGDLRLYIVQSAGTAVQQAADEGTVDLIVLDPPTVILGGKPLLESSRQPSAMTGARGPKPWRRLALERILALSDSPVSQGELAASTGLTQQAVSKALKSLGPLVENHSGRWRAHDRGSLIDHWLENYTGAGGLRTYWYGLDPLLQQARGSMEFALGMEAAPLLAGDLAADRFAPWRLPIKAHLYLRQAVDFTNAGFSPAAPEEATLVTTISADPTLWTTSHFARQGNVPMVDPLVILWDVLRETGPDAFEAADRVRRTILTDTEVRRP